MRLRVIAFVLAAGCAGTTAAADLSVTVVGVKSADGTVRAALYDRAEGFRHEENARVVQSAAAAPGDVSLTFAGLPAGTYAIIAYHDEDGDGAMDKFMGMIPTEGFALTNDPEVTGPPSFDSAAFTLGDTDDRQVVHLKY